MTRASVIRHGANTDLSSRDSPTYPGNDETGRKVRDAGLHPQ